MAGEGWKLGPVKLNYRGFHQLRTSHAAWAWVDRVGEAIAARASALSGEKYGYRRSPGRTRARGVVKAATTEAARDSAANLTLLRAMGAGRD